MTIKSRDKVLPVQPYFENLWRGRADYVDAVADFVTDHASKRLPPLKLAPPPGAPLDKFSSPPGMLAFLAALVSWTGASNILEIGTFAGSTALHLARMNRGYVTTIEACAAFAQTARDNAEANHLSDRVLVLNEVAETALQRLTPGTFDLVFLDGGKQDYVRFAVLAEKLLAHHGLMVIDDVFFHGDALNAQPETPKGLGAREVVEHYTAHSNFHSLLLPLGNGVLIVWRR